MENGTKTKRRPPVKLSLSEIEAAKLLIQLSSGDSEQDRNSNNNNNSNSYSVNHDNKVDSEYVSSSSSISAQPEVTEMSDSEDDESERWFPRRKKRYRYVNEELYRVTSPLPVTDKVKIIKRRRK